MITRVATLDLETTGIDFAKGHRIIEVGLIQAVMGAHGSVKVQRSIIQRINPRRAIPADSTRVHGIKDEDVADCPPFEDIADDIGLVLADCDILVAHNAEFDAPFLAMEMQAVGRSVPDVPIFCTMMNGRFATGSGKMPKLKELCFSLSVPYDDSMAHGAAYDALVTLKCFSRGVHRGLFTFNTGEAA